MTAVLIKPTLAEHAEAIRALGKQTVENIIEIGRRLIEAKELAGRGGWLPWLDREFGWDERTARRFMSVVDLVGKSDKLSDLEIPISGLYLLAAPSTPESAREEIIKRAEAGEPVSVAEVKQTIAEQRAAEAEDEDEGATLWISQPCAPRRRAVSYEEVEQPEAEVEEPIDPATFSMSAQKRMDAWKRQQMREMAQTFRQMVDARVRELLEETILPRHRAEQDKAKRVMNARKGIMDKATFKLIWSALHPDSRKSISDKKLAEAFDAFSGMEKLLLSEKDSPTFFAPLPKTMAEWDKAKAAATAARKAKRANSSSAIRPR